jgi:hypothetical protein
MRCCQLNSLRLLEQSIGDFSTTIGGSSSISGTRSCDDYFNNDFDGN